MKETDKLFYELIRVAIGTQESLSRLPLAREWGELYKMAQKQSLLGVCFAGLQRLGTDSDDPSTSSGTEPPIEGGIHSTGSGTENEGGGGKS